MTNETAGFAGTVPDGGRDGGRAETAFRASWQWRGLNCACEKTGALQMVFELLSG